MRRGALLGWVSCVAIAWSSSAGAVGPDVVRGASVSEGTIEVSLRSYTKGGDFRTPIPGKLLVQWRVEQLIQEPVVYCDAAWLVPKKQLSVWADPQWKNDAIPDEVLKDIRLFDVVIEAAVDQGGRVSTGGQTVMLRCDVGAMGDPVLDGTRGTVERMGEKEQGLARSFNVKGSPKWEETFFGHLGGAVSAEQAKKIVRDRFQLFTGDDGALLLTARVAEVDVSLLSVQAWAKDEEAKALEAKLTADRAARVARAEGRTGGSTRAAPEKKEPALSSDDFWGGGGKKAKEEKDEVLVVGTTEKVSVDVFWDRPTKVETEKEAKEDKAREAKVASLREAAQRLRDQHAEEKAKRLFDVKARGSIGSSVAKLVPCNPPVRPGGVTLEASQGSHGRWSARVTDLLDGRTASGEVGSGRYAGRLCGVEGGGPWIDEDRKTASCVFTSDNEGYLSWEADLSTGILREHPPLSPSPPSPPDCRPIRGGSLPLPGLYSHLALQDTGCPVEEYKAEFQRDVIGETRGWRCSAYAIGEGEARRAVIRCSRDVVHECHMEPGFCLFARAEDDPCPDQRVCNTTVRDAVLRVAWIENGSWRSQDLGPASSLYGPFAVIDGKVWDLRGPLEVPLPAGFPASAETVSFYQDVLVVQGHGVCGVLK